MKIITPSNRTPFISLIISIFLLRFIPFFNSSFKTILQHFFIKKLWHKGKPIYLTEEYIHKLELAAKYYVEYGFNEGRVF